MRAKTLAGPEAGSQKYDLLTALGCHALAADPSTQRLVLRLLTLVTARYNWRLALLQVGQREIARLWSVDERTVKREMAKLRTLGWLVRESPARRGRVASYALDLTAIRSATRPAWSRVGPDFEARMAGPAPADPSRTVVPFPRPVPSPDHLPEDSREQDAFRPREDRGVWARMLASLRAETPAVCANWFDTLRPLDGAGELLVLAAPSAFHANYVRTHYEDRLLAALREQAGPDTVGLRLTTVEDAGHEPGRRA